MVILYYTTTSGNQPVAKWIAGLTGQAAVEVAAVLMEIANHGLTPIVDTRQIDGKLWEIRTRSQRVFYVLIEGLQMVLLHGYKKQSQKAPKKEIEVAKTRAKEVLGK